MVKKTDIEAVLHTIPDPELDISIADLGLIYDVAIDDSGHVTILMTLTTIGCPLFDLIAGPIREKVGALKGVKTVAVELTFEPPWGPERMTEEAKMQLGLI